MARVTVSFTIEDAKLAEVDTLAARLDRDRSSTLRRIIDVALPIVRAQQDRLDAVNLSIAETMPEHEGVEIAV